MSRKEGRQSVTKETLSGSFVIKRYFVEGELVEGKVIFAREILRVRTRRSATTKRDRRDNSDYHIK